MNTTTVRVILRSASLHFARHTLVLGWLVTVGMMAMAGGNKPSVDHAPTPNSPAALMAANDCGSHVQDPTHVVVTTADGVTRYAGQRLTDRAIEQAVFGMDHGLTVHGFCA